MMRTKRWCGYLTGQLQIPIRRHHTWIVEVLFLHFTNVHLWKYSWCCKNSWYWTCFALCPRWHCNGSRNVSFYLHRTRGQLGFLAYSVPGVVCVLNDGSVLLESKLSTGRDLPSNVSTVRGSAAFPRAFMTYLVAVSRNEWIILLELTTRTNKAVV